MKDGGERGQRTQKKMGEKPCDYYSRSIIEDAEADERIRGGGEESLKDGGGRRSRGEAMRNLKKRMKKKEQTSHSKRKSRKMELIKQKCSKERRLRET